MKLLLSIIIVLSLINASFAQKGTQKNELSLTVKYPDNKTRNSKVNVNDSLEAAGYISAYIEQLHSEGFLLAYDSISVKDGNYTAVIYTGERIRASDDSIFISDENGLRPFGVISNGKYYSHLKNIAEREKLLKQFENSGYPFVRIETDSMFGTSGTIAFRYAIYKGPYIVNDSLSVQGDKILKPKFLFSYLQIVPGKPFSNKSYTQAENKLRQLGFIKMARPADIWFGSDKAKLNVYLSKKGANRFQGIAGIVPPSGTEKKTTITGDISLYLVNSLKNADHISLNWKKLDKYGQQLNAEFSYPYIFYLPTGIDLKFDLVKKDSSFINSAFRWNIPYFFSGNNQAGIIIERKSSDVLTSVSVTGISDFDKVSAGMFIKWNNFDRPVIPRKGASVEFSIMSGKKTISNKKDSITTKTSNEYLEQYSSFSYCNSFSKFLGFRADLRSGFLPGNGILTNEQWRLGGFSSLRGFDEESIYAQNYISGNIEIKGFFAEYSNVFMFFNSACYSKFYPENITDFPYGFGWGVEIDTPAGIISLIYALGSQQDNPVEFRNSKVHISLLNRF